MKDLENIEFEKLSAIYNKYFTLNYLNSDLGDKLAVIALTCFITNEVKKKGKRVNCYDILLQVGKDFTSTEKHTFLKSLGAVCEDISYGCNTFPTFGVEPKNAVKQLQELLSKYCPF